MTPLERAAQALYEIWVKDQEGEGLPYLDWACLPVAERVDHIEQARAVLQAIREPSEAMVDAAMDRERFGHDPLPSETFPAMIDAALEEG